MKTINFWMAGAAVTLLATLSGCGGGGDSVGSGGSHTTLTATLPSAATAGVAVSITGITTTNATAVTVDWGDGTQDAPSAIPTTLTHTYAPTATCVTAGLCNIDLAALGWATAAELKGAVVLSPAPTLTATLPTTGTVSVPLSITGLAAAHGTLSVDWGDGTKETPATTSTSLTHTYVGAGSYAIDLLVAGTNNSSAEKKGNVTINAIAQPALTATLPTTGAVGTAVNVTGITTTNGTALSVNWGDGVTETPAVSSTTLTHTYTAAGTYTLGMTLTGSAASTPAQTSGSITIAASGPTPELFISEYIEGTSSNKAIEIYNPTSSTVDLSAYSLEVYANGSSTPITAATATLSGMLPPGKTYVLYNPSAIAALVSAISSNAAIVFKEAAFPAQVTQYNGNDAVVLKKSGVVIDQVGVVGNDPGAAGWGGLTMDHDLRRKAGIVRGTPNLTAPWDPTVEWDITAETAAGPFDGLGNR